MENIGHETQVDMVDHLGKRGYESKRRDLLVVINEFQELAELPGDEIKKHLPDGELALLAGAKDADLHALALRTVSGGSDLTDTEAVISLDSGKLVSKPKAVTMQIDKPQFKMAYENYLTLRERAQIVLNWDTVPEKLN